LTQMGQAISEDAMENMEKDAFEELSDLTGEELERLDNILKKCEREIKKTIRKKHMQEKNVG
jgi:diadenosine tetraphosphate (Ap4A) HIT family hydrolase